MSTVEGAGEARLDANKAKGERREGGGGKTEAEEVKVKVKSTRAACDTDVQTIKTGLKMTGYCVAESNLDSKSESESSSSWGSDSDQA
jgi:hypothetical protein